MSSPLQSLKEKRTPLGGSPTAPDKPQFGKRMMPFRNIDYATNENLLLDEVLPLKMNSRTSNHGLTPRTLLEPIMGSSRRLEKGPLKNSKNEDKTKMFGMAKPPTDMDLMASMMQRITALEKHNLAYTKEIIEKEKRIKVLEEKLLLYQKTNSSSDEDSSKVNKDMERKCLELKHQLYEMETFLAEYGMVWVGDKSNHSSDTYIEETTEKLNQYDQAWENVISDTQSEFQPDYDLVVKNVNELNIIAGDGESHVHKTSNGARLKVAESVRLVLYKNGIMLFNGPFRPFSNEETRRCMTDLMDGYFPSELQTRYPDGVPINIMDNRSVTFRDRRLLEEFPGVGHLLGGEKKPSNLLPVSTSMLPMHSEKLPSSATHSNMTSQHSSMTSSVGPGSNIKKSNFRQETHTNELPVHKLSVEQFVNRLPQSVIRNGNIIDVRADLSKHLQTEIKDSKTQVVETDVVAGMSKSMNPSESEQPAYTQDVTTLRVKTENGRDTFLIKMKSSASIRDVKKYIDKQRPHHKLTYDIVSNFPTKIHSNLSSTLLESGLTPNANVCLRPRNHTKLFKR